MAADFEQLKSLHLFKALSAQQLKQLIDSSRTTQLDKDQTLFRMGDHSEHFHFLVSGQIKIARGSPSGSEKILSIVRPGQLFAEAVMFLGTNKYPATATALQRSEVISFKHSVFVGFLLESTDLSMAMLCNLSVKLHQQIVEIDNLTLQNATFRTVNFLNSLVANNVAESTDVELPAPKHIIASHLSVTPETLSRSLAELTGRGIIKPIGKSRSIHIPNISAFRDYLITC